MNKKFSTLVAGVLLASGVGASAQTFNPQVFSSEPEIRQAKYYALGVGSGATNVVSVTETADGTLAFKSVAANSLNSLAKVDSALWTVSANVTGFGITAVTMFLTLYKPPKLFLWTLPVVTLLW